MEQLYNKFLEIYSKFYTYDLKYSLLIGREYELIYNFLIVYNSSILSEKSMSDSFEDLNKLEELVNDYIDKLKNIFEDEDEGQEFVKVDTIRISNILKDSECVWEHMFKSYNFLTKFTQCNYHKVLLIEINNFFSHILATSQDKDTQDTKSNIKRGVAHLYRAALDGCKEIIKTSSNIICANSSLKVSFLKVRTQESLFLGQKSTADKCDILKQYDNMANTILTLLKRA
ncbi:MAG: hypothetical protein A2513_06910 [Sulfurimonas sp. RIFOXYD12_FULL_33_39]|uniref:hypothetical protein n=1 Tax=unclassified Sulfurimonas TaxID=2623549 RepID=UPI0008B351EF|nr:MULTISPECIES: hypothetical protein [unclassified Sulfurimonas]OHE10582.1 MAG: hypothetical protein A2513_06910 [Sulfurimonas sp. RIFOXYD12_FULL_33_39]OHE15041.1 MAG: hypothetical protein A2530_01100 [Sulfurimonas sp. RIFOXYD2_FULL_34_21]